MRFTQPPPAIPSSPYLHVNEETVLISNKPHEPRYGGTDPNGMYCLICFHDIKQNPETSVEQSHQ